MVEVLMVGEEKDCDAQVGGWPWRKRVRSVEFVVQVIHSPYTII